MSQHHNATQHEKLYQPPTYFNKRLCAAHADMSASHLAGTGDYKKRPLFHGIKQHIKIGFALGVGALGVLALMPPAQGRAPTPIKSDLSGAFKGLKKKLAQSGASQDIWKQIAKDFTLSAYANNPAVLKQIRWYQDHPKSLSDIAAKAAPYLYYIHQQVKEKGLPGELVLLPIIESAYNPFASSSVGAAGLWQLMPGTGSDLGLKQNSGFDGRRDVIGSTQAALSYLSHLDKIFDKNWLLALAAYNSGPGTVLKADKSNKGDHSNSQFWSLHLPQETKQYVPRLLAVAAIIGNPAKYGIHLPDLPNKPYFAKVAIDSPIALSKVAKLSNSSVDKVRTLNPGYVGTQNASATPSHVLIPIEKVATFKENMDTQGKTTTVEMPDPAAVKNTATPTPIPTKKAGPTKTAAKTKTPKDKTIHSRIYKVKTGDSMSSIAKKQGVTLAALQKANHLKSDDLKIGQVLTVPAKA